MGQGRRAREGLRLFLFGPFEATLNGAPITSFRSNQARAFLSYLAMEPNVPHSREALAELFWPERPHPLGRNNVRFTLSNIRQALGDRGARSPFLLVTRNTVRFQCDRNAWVDAAAFEAACQCPDLAQAETALRLWRGGFLEGAVANVSPPFEEWVRLQQGRMERALATLLQRLGRRYENLGDPHRACSMAVRRAELDPWDEEAHRDVMRLLAADGRRHQAAAHYEAYRTALAHGADLKPAKETTALLESIRKGAVVASAPVADTPPNRIPGMQPALWKQLSLTPASPCVGRNEELHTLHGWLGEAARGHGRVAFITGEAGAGKTVLAGAFVCRALDRHPEIIVSFGGCDGLGGAGIPYQPFGEALRLLAGDAAARRADGLMVREAARQLAQTASTMLDILRMEGPTLLGTLVPEPSGAGGSAQGPARNRISPEPHSGPGRGENGTKLPPANPGSPQIVPQVLAVLKALCRHQPVLLVLDDLQWTDAKSLSLLFHISRQLRDSRLLLLGLFRPVDESQHGLTGGPSLPSVVNECQRLFGDVVLDLGKAQHERFMEAVVDLEPNRLGPAFRQKLFRQTGGNALFTVELLKDLKECGGLTRNDESLWIEGPTLHLARLPARIEGVFAERVAKLPALGQRLLEGASVLGERFTAEDAASLAGCSLEEGLQILKTLVEDGQPMVQAEGLVWTLSRPKVSFRFRHVLFQRYLHDRINPIARSLLHARAADALLSSGGHGTDAMEALAPALSRHYEASGRLREAAACRAVLGRRALALSAHEEALAHFERGLAMLAGLRPSAERDREELNLLFGSSLAHLGRGWISPERVGICGRAHDLALRLGAHRQAFQAALHLTDIHRAAGHKEEAMAWCGRARDLALQAGGGILAAMADSSAGITYALFGDLGEARRHLEQVPSPLAPEDGLLAVEMTGLIANVSAQAWLASVLALLGEFGEASHRIGEALSQASSSNHPFSEGQALLAAGLQARWILRDEQGVRTAAAALHRLASRHHLDLFSSWARLFGGWCDALNGGGPKSISQMERAVGSWRESGAHTGLPQQLLVLAQAQEAQGEYLRALPILEEAMAIVEETDLRSMSPEILRMQGVCRWALARTWTERGKEEEEAEALFMRSLAEADRMGTRAWSLRTSASLARLLEETGRPREGRRILQEVLAGFPPNLATPDLDAARGILNAFCVA